mmetsp:Transcript_44781/g.83666  ORF Transcript_44781/g.83666 Transcript_44781/m.83666 type:complete len:301 (-) Transcript_44781:195-1097(-)
MAKNRTMPSFLLSAAAAAVAGLLLLVSLEDAFVGPAPSSARSTVPTWQTKQVAPTAIGLNTPDQDVGLFKTAASAALLCLAAARMIKGRCHKPATVRRAVVSLTLGATTPSAKNIVVHLPDVPCQFEETATVDTLVDTTPVVQSIPSFPELIFLDSDTPSLAVTPGVDSPALLCGKPRPARFAAGARRSQRAQRAQQHSRRASRASRRAVGRQLCERLVSTTVPTSFDASKMRTKIQLGLRVSSCMRSESGRESKVSSGVEGSEMGTCLNFVAHDLKVYMLDHGSALTDAVSSDCELELH